MLFQRHGELVRSAQKRIEACQTPSNKKRLTGSKTGKAHPADAKLVYKDFKRHANAKLVYVELFFKQMMGWRALSTTMPWHQARWREVMTTPSFYETWGGWDLEINEVKKELWTKVVANTSVKRAHSHKLKPECRQDSNPNDRNQGWILDV